MRIEVIAAARRHEHEDLLKRAFTLRHDVFVETRGWDFLRRDDRLDIDRYDAGSTVHVLAIDKARVLGHVRIIPGGYLAVARADPARIREAAGDAQIDGLSRFCVAPSLHAPLRESAIVRLFSAALSHLIERGTGALLFDTDPSIIFILRVLGFSIERVGESTLIAGRTMQPIVMRLDSSALSALPMKIAAWTRHADVTIA